MKFHKFLNSGESETPGLPKPEIIEIGMAGAVHCLSCKIPCGWNHRPSYRPSYRPSHMTRFKYYKEDASQQLKEW